MWSSTAEAVKGNFSYRLKCPVTYKKKKKKLRKIEELEFQSPLMQHEGWKFQAVKVGNSEFQTLHYVHGLYKTKEENHLCRNPKLYQFLESFYNWLRPRDNWSDTYWLQSAALTSTENFQKAWHCEISLLCLLRDLKNYFYGPERILPSRRQKLKLILHIKPLSYKNLL